MIKWSDALLIGIPEIDDQHRAFVTLVDRFQALSQHHPSRDKLRAILVDLMSYAEVHFIAEERHMRCAGYPRLVAHALKHHAAAASIHALLAQDTGSIERYRFLANFLKTWLVDHIMGDDKAFGAWIERNRPTKVAADLAEAG
ncbi:bacteriohemerythrin [Azospirillum sp. sgz301742]